VSDKVLGTCDADIRALGSQPHTQTAWCENWRPQPNLDYLAATGLKSGGMLTRDVTTVDGMETATEWRVVDPETGGAKGQKPARFDLLPPDVLFVLAEHYGKGAEKYDDHNWKRGYAWSLSFAALNRHLWAFWNGEDVDPETGSPHLAAVLFHAAALLHYMQNEKGTDDRWREPTV
jgi:hypothetical protein